MRKNLAIVVALALVIGVALGAYLVFFGETDHRYRKHDSARAQIELLAGSIDLFKEDTGSLPRSLTDLIKQGSVPRWSGPYIQDEGLLDPWGAAFYYRAHDSDQSYILFTLGSEGRIGGHGNARDIQVERSQAGS